jgi:phosphoribosylanthranilate isomerase
VAVDVKFCGMTRAEDIIEAARLGASYVGVIFAGGPRQVTVDQAESILRAAPSSVRRVGVFGTQRADEIGEIADRVGLDVVQLHAGGDVKRAADVRSHFGGEVWSVVSAEGASLPTGLAALFATADAVLLDSRVPGKLGGTGVPMPWSEIATALRKARGNVGRLVLAGGLRPENVVEAIDALHPDVVDVSSGIEVSPGEKDHRRMRLFMDAVQSTQVAR